MGKCRTSAPFGQLRGDAFGGPDENKADCFAVGRGRNEGWLTHEGLEQVCEFIGAGRADAMHPGGPERCACQSAL